VNPINRLFASADASPDAIAICSPAYSTTFTDLATSVRIFSSALKGAGIKAGQVVGVACRPEIECVIALALMQIGAISLTATQQVLRAYKDRIDFVITDDEKMLFRQGRTLRITEEYLGELGKFRPDDQIAEMEPETIVRLVFSSGTTGTPKGVPFTAQNLIARTNSARRNWMPELPFMSLLGLDTVTGMQTFFWSVFNGQTFFAASNGDGNLKLIAENGVRSIKSSPARLKDLVAAAEASQTATKLEVIQVAGSLLDSRTVRLGTEVFGIIPTYLYGSTEVGTVTRGKFKPEAPNNLGKPVDDIDFEIVDERGSAVSRGTLGRIRYRKDGMPTGYWLQTDSKTTGFIEGWFYPGDFAHLNTDGELELSGRTDDLVNLGGAKFNLLELDTWLQGLEIFDEVAAFKRFNEFNELEIGIAFVSALPPIPEILAEQVRSFLPDLDYQYLIRLEKLPRNKLDKVDRSALASHVSRLG
jgi:acyl-coenzyme A synthetase/AMP-(fatty) acid ligase